MEKQRKEIAEKHEEINTVQLATDSLDPKDPKHVSKMGNLDQFHGLRGTATLYLCIDSICLTILIAESFLKVFICYTDLSQKKKYYSYTNNYILLFIFINYICKLFVYE